MIKTVIFDLGGVYFTDGTKSAVEIISQKFNIPKEKVKEVLSGDLGAEYRKGNISATKFWQEAKDFWKIKADSKELGDIWITAYITIPGVKELIERLKKEGYELIFLSDNVKERVEYLEKNYHFLKHFKDGIFSHLVHLKKPNPEIYKLILKKSSHPAKNCVYIDDKPALLEPAKELGMSAIAFQSADQLEKELINLGLKF